MAVPFSENGGFLATTFFIFCPTQASDSGASYIGIFDPSSFDDPNNGSSYSYKIEDVIVGRVPTVRRVILVYKDLGPATITVQLSGTNDNNNIVTASVKAKLGTTGATGALLTAFADVTLTAFRPQLTLSRAAGGGPLSIISATLVGEIEDISL
jgi:hypothetical protein